MNTKTITVLQTDQGEYNYPPYSLADFIGFFQNIFVDIPPEYRHTARVDMSIRESYGDHYPAVEVTYTRPETPKETEEREQAALRATRASEERERALYEKLKAKYQ